MNTLRNITPPMVLPTLRLNQPLGEFFAVSLPASFLLQITHVTPLRLIETDVESGGYDPEGVQRELNVRRSKEIATFIDGAESAFPNSIILAANYTEEGEFVGDNPDRSWGVKTEKGGRYSLIIPTAEKLAAIIDGQHRVAAFKWAMPARQDMELLCAIYLDLPSAFQAYLFATINFHQKPVSKSLAYELFAFGIDGKKSDTWPPEKLAVFLCRRLNVDEDSALRHRIKVFAENRLEFKDEGVEPLVSTATVVEGLLHLFSASPRLDRDQMATVGAEEGRSRSMLGFDGSPLRQLYLDGQDAVIYALAKNFFRAVDDLLLKPASERSYVRKTVGIQALFDVLKQLSTALIVEHDVSVARIKKLIRPLADVDFADSFFQASGKGRARLKNTMLLKLKKVELSMLPSGDLDDYARLTT